MGDLIKYANGLVAQYYQTKGNKKLVLRLAGAPGMPSSSETEAMLLAGEGYDFIRPDYYGYARSNGFFSPKSCIQTAYDTIQSVRQTMPFLSLHTTEESFFSHYDEIVVIGFSYGAWIAAIMPKFDLLISEVILLSPYLGYDDMNVIGYLEESHEEFLRQFYLFYQNIYRFIEGQNPYDALLDIGSLSPLHDSSHLIDTEVFIAHGTADTSIWHGRSQNFHKQLLAMNPLGKYTYIDCYGLGHDSLCRQTALQSWLSSKKSKIII